MARWRVIYIIPGTKAEEKQLAIDVPDTYNDAMKLKDALEKGEVKDAYFVPGTVLSVTRLKGGF